MKHHRCIIVGFSGGVTSAYCAAWALEEFDRDEVVLLFHDTKEEDEDTYRFNREMSKYLGKPITERSDGRSVTEVFRDEGAIANNRMAFCSRILKVEQFERYIKEIRVEGITEIINVLGYTAMEPERQQRAYGRAVRDGYVVRFPLVEQGITKQACADWCLAVGVRPSSMYEWSDHANCVGCVRGGKGYWLAVEKNRPEVFAQRVALEAEFGHTILKDTSLVDLSINGMKRPAKRRECIDIGPCECGT